MADHPLDFVHTTGYRLLVEVLRDGGNPDTAADWIDLNEPFPGTATNSFPDYGNGLLAWPNLRMTQETGRRSYCTTVDSLEMDNSPWLHNAYGLFSAPLPVTIRRAGVDYTISAWAGRRLRLRVQVYSAAGRPLSIHNLGHFRVRRPKRKGHSAHLELEGLQGLLMRSDASTVKDGTAPFLSMPVGFLMSRLAKAADPSIGLDAGLASTLDLGLAKTPRASSWGSVPGRDSAGNPSGFRWVPRSIARDPSNPDLVWIGLEVPGTGQNPDGAIVSLNVTNGQSSVLIGPSTLSEWVPFHIFLANNLTGPPTLYAALHQEAEPDPANWHFASIRIVKTLTDGTGLAWPGTSHPFWNCRETLRRGTFSYLSTNNGQWCVGYSKNASLANRFFGEDAVLPFPQCVDILVDWIWNKIPDAEGVRPKGYTHEAEYSSDWIGSPLASLYEVIDPGEYPNRWTLTGPGHYAAKIRDGSTVYLNGAGLGVRYFMQPHLHPPTVKDQASDGNYRLYYITLSIVPSLPRFSINAYILSTGALEYWPLTNLGEEASQIWRRQVTAFAISPGQAGTGRVLLIATMDWNEREDAAGPPASTVTLSRAVLGTSGTAATTETRWTQTPTGSIAWAPTIVRLWTPYSSLALEGQAMAGYTVAVICDRGHTGKPNYGLAFWMEGADPRWIQFHRRTTGTAPEPLQLYTGPESSLPFDGFAADASDASKFYFVDQATGLLWSATVTTTAPQSVTYALENGARPIHGSALCVSSPTSAYAAGSDGVPRYLFGMSPSTPAAVRRPYFARAEFGPSALRLEAAISPLVQYSQALTDIVEIADFTGLKTWEAIELLAQIAWNYDLTITAAGRLALLPREAGTSIATLYPADEVPVADPEDEAYILEGPLTSYTDEDGIINAVDATPFDYAPADLREPDQIGGPASTFAGQFLYALASGRPINLAITCTTGGDILQGSTTNTQRALLFRYSRILETVNLFLLSPASYSSTSISVGNLRGINSRLYAGDQEIRTGDRVRVLDSTICTITGFSLAADGTSATLTLDRALSSDTSFAAPTNSEVLLTPQDGTSGSDEDAGVTTLLSGIGSETTITLRDASVLRRDQAIRLEEEWILIRDIRGNDLIVTRGAFLTSVRSHAASTPVRAYVHLAQAGRLYEVGDTGVLFGVQAMTADAELAARTLSSGDGLILRAGGRSYKANEHATLRFLQSASIKRHERRDFTLKNPFLDATRAETLAEDILEADADPRIVIEGGTMPYLPAFTARQTVTFSSSRHIPTGTPTDFQIVDLAINLSRGIMAPKLRAYDATAGAGKTDPTPTPPTPGHAVPRGRRRRNR